MAGSTTKGIMLSLFSVVIWLIAYIIPAYRTSIPAVFVIFILLYSGFRQTD